MSLVRFEHAVALEPHEIASMACALDDLLTGAGGTWPPRSYELVVGAGRLLLAWHPHQNPHPNPRPDTDTGRGRGRGRGPAVTGARARDARLADGARTTVVEVATGEVLDVAADLLDAAEVLLVEGHLVAGYAIEGLQGRLIEAAVGVGRIERGASSH
ncbi:MAG: hypothetical protein ACYCST_14945 [Acidimicrobiales bacterium]